VNVTPKSAFRERNKGRRKKGGGVWRKIKEKRTNKELGPVTTISKKKRVEETLEERRGIRIRLGGALLRPPS